MSNGKKDKFPVPKGKGVIEKIFVFPPATDPAGSAWPMVDANGDTVPEDGLNVVFPDDSTEPERNDEFLTFHFVLPGELDGYNWTFYDKGLIFDDGSFKDPKNISTGLLDEKTLEFKVSCKEKVLHETFKFLFFAKRVASDGAWMVVTSKDPAGDLGRN